MKKSVTHPLFHLEFWLLLSVLAINISRLIVALMLTTQINQGISFMTQGKIIKKFGNSVE